MKDEAISRLLTANDVDEDRRNNAVIKQQPTSGSKEDERSSFSSSSGSLFSVKAIKSSTTTTTTTTTTLTSQTVMFNVKAIGYLTWFWGVVYALFIVVYYGTTWWWSSIIDRSSYKNNHDEGRSKHLSLEEAWNYVDDPTMFEVTKPMQSQIFLWMIFGPGAYLLVVGPLQFVPSLRSHSNSVRTSSIHTWLGRTILLANLSTAVGGILYLLLIKDYRTLHPTLEDHGDFATLVFGILVLICTVQTYRYAPPSHSSSEIAKTSNGLHHLHRQWAYRLTALQAGNVLFRLYVTSFKLYLQNQKALMATSPTTTTNDEDNANFYGSMLTWSFFVPNLVFVELYLWYTAMNRNKRKGITGRGPPRKQNTESDIILSSQSLCSSSVETFTSFMSGLVFLLLFIMGTLTTIYLWIPGIIWCIDTNRSELPSFYS